MYEHISRIKAMPISFQYQQSRLFPLELIDADDNESVHIKASQPPQSNKQQCPHQIH